MKAPSYENARLPSSGNLSKPLSSNGIGGSRECEGLQQIRALLQSHKFSNINPQIRSFIYEKTKYLTEFPKKKKTRKVQLGKQKQQ